MWWRRPLPERPSPGSRPVSSAGTGWRLSHFGRAALPPSPPARSTTQTPGEGGSSGAAYPSLVSGQGRTGGPRPSDGISPPHSPLSFPLKEQSWARSGSAAIKYSDKLPPPPHLTPPHFLTINYFQVIVSKCKTGLLAKCSLSSVCLLIVCFSFWGGA